MFAEDVRRAGVVEGGTETHAPGHLGDDPPIRFRFAGRGQEGALARDAPLGIGHAAILLAPGRGGQAHVGVDGGVGAGGDVGHHQEFAGLQGGDHRVRLGQAHRRVGGHDPQGLDAALGHGAEQLHRLEARLPGQVRRPPETADPIQGFGVEIHVGGQLIGQAAHLPPAHGVGLAGEGKRPGAGPADAAGGEMDVEDGVDLVDAGTGLVDALGEGRHGARGGGEQAEKFRHVRLGQAAFFGDTGDGQLAHGGEGGAEAFHVGFQPGPVHRVATLEVVEQAMEQPGVAARAQGQVQVRQVCRSGAPGIDQHHLHGRPGLPGRCQALEQHRVGPGGVGAHQHHQVGQFQILVAARHRVAAEGALVAGHGGGHAQAGIGVDVGRADEALHQLVGHVVVLGEQLAGDVKGHRVRAVLGDDLLETPGHRIQGGVPAHPLAVDFRMQQTGIQAQGFAQGGALGTQAAEIGRMIRVAAQAEGRA